MSACCLLARIYGQVQGVGFRYHAQNQAQALGLRGWVRNLPDGSVETLICGSPEQVKAMQQWLAHGPAHAMVTDIDYTAADPVVAGRGFTIR